MITMVDAIQEDEAFMYEVYRSTRLQEVSAWGWGDKEMEAFLRMQFDIRQRSYRVQYPQAQHWVLVSHDVRVGRIIVHESSEGIRLIDVSVLPEFRNQGVGTAALIYLQDMAKARTKAIRLHVTHSNPAISLYERAGFRRDGGDDVYTQMEWKAEKFNGREHEWLNRF